MITRRTLLMAAPAALAPALPVTAAAPPPPSVPTLDPRDQLARLACHAGALFARLRALHAEHGKVRDRALALSFARSVIDPVEGAYDAAEEALDDLMIERGIPCFVAGGRLYCSTTMTPNVPDRPQSVFSYDLPGAAPPPPATAPSPAGYLVPELDPGDPLADLANRFGELVDRMTAFYQDDGADDDAEIDQAREEMGRAERALMEAMIGRGMNLVCVRGRLFVWTVGPDFPDPPFYVLRYQPDGSVTGHDPARV